MLTNTDRKGTHKPGDSGKKQKNVFVTRPRVREVRSRPDGTTRTISPLIPTAKFLVVHSGSSLNKRKKKKSPSLVTRCTKGNVGKPDRIPR